MHFGVSRIYYSR